MILMRLELGFDSGMGFYYYGEEPQTQKKEQAEQARLKYPERERKTIGVGVIRIKG
jgi:hypothetical protein